MGIIGPKVDDDGGGGGEDCFSIMRTRAIDPVESLSPLAVPAEIPLKLTHHSASRNFTDDDIINPSSFHVNSNDPTLPRMPLRPANYPPRHSVRLSPIQNIARRQIPPFRIIEATQSTCPADNLSIRNPSSPSSCVEIQQGD